MLKYSKNNYDKVFILSAKYGLLELDTIISTYEKTLNKIKKEEKNIWYSKVSNSINEKIDEEDELFIMCGKNYYEGLLQKINLT